MALGLVLGSLFDGATSNVEMPAPIKDTVSEDDKNKDDALFYSGIALSFMVVFGLIFLANQNST